MITDANAQGASIEAETALLADLHQPRDRAGLRRLALAELVATLPDRDFAILVSDDDGHHCHVELARGAGCPLQAGSDVEVDAWRPADASRFELRYGRHLIGHIIVAGALPEPQSGLVGRLAHHFAIALVNIKLNDSERSTADSYRASLQAYEQGVALFQEQRPDAIAARFLGMCMSVLGAEAGAVYILQDLGGGKPELQLDQCLGVPEQMLENLLDQQGNPWPTTLVGAQLRLPRRDRDGNFEDLDGSQLPAALHNIVGAPLSYYGVDVGVCVLFNARCDAASIASTQRLFELGAAIFHRRELQARAVRNRELETQLGIAAVLQARCMPQTAPAVEDLEFAWRSVPAQYIGGDYVDILEGNDGRLHCVVADVSGHGVNSALVMTSFRANYRSSTALFGAAETLMRANNDIVREVGDTGMFLTVAAVDIDPKSRSFQLASAGHNPVLVYRPAADKFFALEASGPPMGLFSGVDYDGESFQCEPGDYLLLYTDGVVEAATEDDADMFGDERLQDIVRQQHAAGAAPMLEAIYAEVTRFSGRQRQTDDVSVLIVRFR